MNRNNKLAADVAHIALMAVSGAIGVFQSSVASIWLVDQRHEEILSIVILVLLLLIMVFLWWLERSLANGNGINVLRSWIGRLVSPWTIVLLIWGLVIFAYLFHRDFFLPFVTLGIFSFLTASFLNRFKVEISHRPSIRTRKPLRPSLSKRVRPFVKRDGSDDELR